MFGHVTKRLSAYCDGELPAAERARVAAHLAACARCRAEYEEVRLGVALASHLETVPAPDTLWSRVEAELDSPAAATRDSRLDAAPAWQDWRAWGAVAAVLALGIWLGMQWMPGETGRPVATPPAVTTLTPTVYDLGEYLRPVQAASARGSFQQIASAPPRFVERRREEKFPAEWLNRVINGPAPLAGFALEAVRSGTSNGAPIVQLVYSRSEAEAFSVFVAPKRVEFRYGREVAYEAEVGGMSCRRVDCPKQRTFEFGEGGFKCVLVSKSFDDRTAAQVMNFFLEAYRN
jgi:anti-sigma factor RsiW